MAYSNVHAYPLSFPNEDQQILISSYSSLANALGTDPGNASQRPLRAACDAITHSQSIYLDTLPVSNPSYPYPARNVFNPGTYHATTPLPVSNEMFSSNASAPYSEIGLSGSLPGYDVLPQPFEEVDEYQAGTKPSVVRFLRRKNKMPYSLWDLLAMHTMPDLVNGDLPIFVQSPGRSVKIKITWPGYSRYPFEKRISTKRDVPFTPTLLLMTLAYHIRDFIMYIQNEGAVVEPGQERWRVTEVPGGAPAMWRNCILTALQHKTGCIWQPVIYYPRG